ncbi:hypothetical protein [Myceligenerans crystallogenes]|uniref:Uncharacterized protein n=1 Tax=Myceligenerans crystallogenes TaxID=316335 RepID=A0ABN2NLL6_9MICO
MQHLPGRLSSALLAVLILMGSSVPVAAALPVAERSSAPERDACFLDLSGTGTEGGVCPSGEVPDDAAGRHLGPHEQVPPTKPSFYITVHDTEWAWRAGCDMGRQDESLPGTQQSVMVLAFGQTEPSPSGVYRLSYFHGPDQEFDVAAEMAIAMGHGYGVCTGSDETSRLWIGMGTNNFPDSAVNRRAGKTLAIAARDAARELGSGYQSTIWGANDFEAWGETDPSLNDRSRAWLDGYNDVPGRPPLVNFGSTDACPWDDVPEASSCSPGHTAETIVYVSTQGAARALPEIYTPEGTQAAQWALLARYAWREGTPMRFAAVMSQHGACGQRGGCEGIDNPPETSWLQLNQHLDRNWRTTATPGAPTDIFWQENLLEDEG